MNEAGRRGWTRSNGTREGLVPAIAQDAASGRILMLAWMNREALELTAGSGQAVYWSRSRERLWRKGEESGHVQRVREIRLDCDGDVVLLSVEQVGGIACHTGRERCFFRRLEDGPGRRPSRCSRTPARSMAARPAREPVMIDPTILQRLAETLEPRKSADPKSSYVAQLFAKGHDAILKKVARGGGRDPARGQRR